MCDIWLDFWFLFWSKPSLPPENTFSVNLQYNTSSLVIPTHRTVLIYTLYKCIYMELWMHIFISIIFCHLPLASSNKPTKKKFDQDSTFRCSGHRSLGEKDGERRCNLKSNHMMSPFDDNKFPEWYVTFGGKKTITKVQLTKYRCCDFLRWHR